MHQYNDRWMDDMAIYRLREIGNSVWQALAQAYS